MSDTKLAISNGWGTFEWALPEYDGSASDLARACFEKAEIPYVDPFPHYAATGERKPAPGPNCPKCGAASHCTWLRAGETKTGRPDLRGLGKPVGARGERYTVADECLLRQCACGYEWLAPIVGNGGER